ncbi:MAG TPA: phage terminase large subunit [Pyrinomonadaceae bacterium]|nr:phage terminase large subunit [Pyrinomonadaceae bacterium]
MGTAISTDLACALDPSLMARRAGVTLDDWQRNAARSTARQVLLNCSRQSGKSLTVAIIIVHMAMYRPGSLILILSHALRQAGELFRKCVEVYAALGKPVPLDVENKLSLETVTGSRIVQLPDKEGNVRSFSNVGLLVLEEAGEISESLYYTVRPMLAVSQGRIIMLGTPKGKRGVFFKEWTEGGDEWERYMVTAYECPRIDRQWLEAERRRVPDWWFRQEYLCEFLETLDSVFRYEDIQRAVSDETVTPLFG